MKNALGVKRAVFVVLFAGMSTAVFAGGDIKSQFANRESIRETRHNLTQRPTLPGPDGRLVNGSAMDFARNDYREVCVYCHTPHGANSTTNAPLWNRTQNPNNNYITYAQLGTSTLTQPVSQPGINSLTCLSCHDGTTAVDSIINMPGSGRYQESQEISVDQNFLATWQQRDGSSIPAGSHQALTSGTGCLVCHSQSGSGNAFPLAGDFAIFEIGLDLRNDHPVGIRFPVGSDDFNSTSGTTARGDAFFDLDGDSRMDKGEVRLYETSEGPEVECASCHDPHGVESAGAGSQFNPTFLRVSNVGSALCMTCHVK